MNGKIFVVLGMCLGVGIGVGSALMYCYDPELGNRRRSRMAYKLNRVSRRARKLIDKTSRELKAIEIPNSVKRLVPEKARAMMRA